MRTHILEVDDTLKISQFIVSRMLLNYFQKTSSTRAHEHMQTVVWFDESLNLYELMAKFGVWFHAYLMRL